MLSSCASLGTAKNNEPQTQVTPDVIITEVFEPEATLVECTEQNNEVNIQVQITPSEMVQVTVVGLQTGENIVLVYERNLPESDWRREKGQITFTPITSIGENGKFEDSWSVSEFDALEDITPNEWMVKVIHEHGVACASFIPPKE